MCFGPFKRACHWGPLIAFAIIKAVTMTTIACLSQWWPPWFSWGGSIVFFVFMSSVVLTLYFFMHAMFTGPGILPKGWKPTSEADCAFLQYCSACEGFKAPRVHHCRKCGSCNMKMDHHCPWINNCVGHGNHTSFTLFLFFAIVGCCQSTFILTTCIYKAVNKMWYIYHGPKDEPIIHMTLWGLVGSMFCLGLAIGVIIAVGMLLFFQLRGILRNRTGIEDWILEKAIYRRGPSEKQFIYPYNLGRWRNFCQVINFSLEPRGNGTLWPVAKGCNQYTLTIEQLNQKAEKRARARQFTIVEGFSGWWFPFTKGICICCHPPCTDEPRIQLHVGDQILVTRWKKYWLYGDRIYSESKRTENSRHRGWFPRRCAVELQTDVGDFPLCNSKPKKYFTSNSNEMINSKTKKDR